ncbi:MAG: EamA family transporter [Candidatus Acidiferrales bacterium]|jgi:drug/metabolite transporter (DMT)-like permease
MRSDRSLRRKTYVLLALMVVFGSVGNTILDKGMKALGALSLSSLAAVRTGFIATISSATVWLGIACMIVFFVSHMLALSGADYSFVMPFSALTYALVPLLALLFLHEPVSALRWVGIVLIFFGVVLVNRTPPRTTGAAHSEQSGKAH